MPNPDKTIHRHAHLSPRLSQLYSVVGGIQIATRAGGVYFKLTGGEGSVDTNQEVSFSLEPSALCVIFSCYRILPTRTDLEEHQPCVVKCRFRSGGLKVITHGSSASLRSHELPRVHGSPLGMRTHIPIYGLDSRIPLSLYLGSGI